MAVPRRGGASLPNAFEEDDSLAVHEGAPLGLAAESVQQGALTLTEQGPLDYHVADVFGFRRLVLVIGKAPVGGREWVGVLVDVGAVGEVGYQVVLGADGRGGVDEAEGLAARLVDRSIGWAWKVSG